MTTIRRNDASIGISQRSGVSDSASVRPGGDVQPQGRTDSGQPPRVPGWDGASTFERIAAGTSKQVGGPPRPDLGQIQRNYQVEDDSMVKWSPSALGVVPIPFTGEYEVTATEARMLDGLSVSRGLVGLNTFNNIKDQAFEVSERLYPNPRPMPAGLTPAQQREWVNNDGHRDAFRHAYWNALMTREFGAEWTRQFATAHEGLPGNYADREAMDLYNNEVGRQIAVANPNASPEQLATLVRQAVTDGRMVVINPPGNLQWSDRVPYGGHSLSNRVAGAGGQPRPDGNASAR